MNSRKKAGFTLIEMLVVIAIIAILVAILMPVISSVQEKARQGRCSANLMQIATAIRAYKTDYHRYPFRPYFDDAAWMYMGGVSALYPDYLSSNANLVCPNDASNLRGVSNQPKNYSTYNGLIHGIADSSFTDSTQADYWRFEAAAGGVGNGSVLCLITYNYGGFSNNGWDESWWDSTLTPPGWNMLVPQGGAVPAWLASEGKKWRHFPRLANPRAPDNTIICRCRAHHKWYGRDETDANPEPGKWRDVIVRLGGEAETVDYAPMTNVVSGGASAWKIQE
ncbi:MAG: prepilin-type N-terminal cleavage/methylation domain-containing protein [Armatimonadetes bacterium]|nr:prepilin-type N-terminal cleavage/methylation domain-containing protein [Armatimonadota bacterium]